MLTYEFTLHLAGVSEVTLEMADRLFAAGCDDASPGACGGRASVDFAREGGSLREAVVTAIANVRAAGYEVARVASDDFDTINSINSELVETAFANTLQRYESDLLGVVGELTDAEVEAVRDARQLKTLVRDLTAQRQMRVKELLRTVNDLIRNVPIPVPEETQPR